MWGSLVHMFAIFIYCAKSWVAPHSRFRLMTR